MADPYINYGQTGMGMTPYDAGYTAPVVRTNTAFPKSTGVDWRGIAKTQTVPDYSRQDTTQNTIQTTTKALSTIATMTGPSTGGTGFIVAGIIQLVGGIIGAMARPKPHRNPEEIAFERMVKFYRDLGKRSNVARSVASLFTGKPKSSFTNIGGTPMELYKKNPTAYQNSLVQPTGA